MVRSTASKVMWVGRATVFLVGLAVILALIFGVASTALGANGDNFRLGKKNVASAISRLIKQGPGPALKLQVGAGQPPLAVNSPARVANLNADRLDGKSANDLIRVASAKDDDNARVGSNGVVLTTSITAPTAGFLVIDASSDVFNKFTSTFATCFIRVDGTVDVPSDRAMQLNGTTNNEEDCATNTVVPVAAGVHTVNLEAGFISSADTTFDESTLTALFVPFSGSGATPTAAAIANAEEAREAKLAVEGSQPNR